MSDHSAMIAKARASGLRVLTDKGGPYEVAPKYRDVLCLTSDHTLHVAKGELLNAEVRTLIDRLRRDKIIIEEKRIHETSITFLHELYKNLAPVESDGARVARVLDGQDGPSDMQRDVMRIIRDAVDKGASDIHFVLNPRVLEIAYRIHGEMFHVNERPSNVGQRLLATLYGSMCDVSSTLYNSSANQDARFRTELAAQCGLFAARISSGPTDTDPGAVLVTRLLYDSNKRIQTLTELGFLPEQCRDIELMQRRAVVGGVNILSGSTGSGKSTTASTILSDIISRERATQETEGVGLRTGIKVFTIEDPPEYRIPGAVQTPLVVPNRDNPEDVRIGWLKAISALVRRDPDMALIGEIRDHDSAKAVFDLATTGHGVYSTLHTTDAVSIMARLKGLNVDRDLMLDPDIMTGLINQSLAQKLCPHCRIPWEKGKSVVGADQRKRIERYCQTEGVYLRGTGCSECVRGIMGRIVIAETIVPNMQFMEVFEEKGKVRAKEYWIKEMGGISKCQALIRRINEGFVDPVAGDSTVIALDNDFIALGIDYGKGGNFEAPATAPQEFWGLQPKRHIQLVS
ncbi:MAG: GspE/PulE family protein [Acidithiobacillus sp.]